MDPDILVGYEIQLLSWGYLLQRASTLNTNMAVAISRIPTAKTSSHMSAEKDEFGADYASEIHIAGRIVLNLWRLLRHEVSYVMFVAHVYASISGIIWNQMTHSLKYKQFTKL